MTPSNRPNTHRTQALQPNRREKLDRPVLNVLAILLGLFLSIGQQSAQAVLPNATTNLAVLVVTANSDDATLPAIKQALDFLGTPYTVHIATATPGALTADKLRNAATVRGLYSAVILTNSQLAYTPDGGATWASGLTTAEWTVLNQYQTDFAVRQINLSGYPTPDTGFNYPTDGYDSTTRLTEGKWSAAAVPFFPYLVTTNAFTVAGAWTYLAKPFDANTTAWLSDASGNALIAVKKFTDGREVLSMNFEFVPWLRRGSALAQGLVTWANKGVFLGERHTYLCAQVDDVFLANEMWAGGEFRQNANDWKATIEWQKKFNKTKLGKDFRFDMTFNGLGTAPGEYVPDDLTPYAKKEQDKFKWINHTYTHPYLDDVTYAEAVTEITTNNQVATNLKLKHFSKLNMVTPNITGLKNPQFIKAAYDSGLRYLVTDTSIPEHRPAVPNTGIPNWVDPRILMIPRNANNLFYNVSTPDEWASEYNSIYRTYWGRDLTYAEILDDQGELLLGFLLKGDISPLMFHQPNLRNYNGAGNTLLGDLLDKVTEKYEKLYNFPALSPTMDVLGTTLKERMDYFASGVVANRNVDNTVTIKVVKAAKVPVTGLKDGNVVTFTGIKPLVTRETYAGQRITYVTLAAGQSVTLK